MAEFLHEGVINHKGQLVGGVSLSDEELDNLQPEDIEFSDQKINTNILVEECTEGTLFKLELDIDEEDIPEVEDRVYDHTYDDIETQLKQLSRYRRKRRASRQRRNKWNTWESKLPIEENCIIGLLKEVREDKVVFKLYDLEGTITVKPYQFKAIYPCFDKPLSVELDLYDEVLAHTI